MRELGLLLQTAGPHLTHLSLENLHRLEGDILGLACPNLVSLKLSNVTACLKVIPIFRVCILNVLVLTG